METCIISSETNRFLKISSPVLILLAKYFRVYGWKDTRPT